MDRFQQRSGEGRRENRYRGERQWANRGDYERDRGDHFERDDWREDPESGSEYARRFGRGFGEGDAGPRRGILEDWQEPRQYGRDAERGPRSGTQYGGQYGERGEGQFGGSHRGFERQDFDSGRSGGGDSYGRFRGTSFEPRRSERFADPYRQGAQPGQPWGESYTGSPFGNDYGYGPSYPPYGGGRFDEDRQSGSFSGKGPKGYQRSDDRIREDLCDCLTADPRIDAEGINITVRQGEVTLEGTVPTRQMKRAAEDLAEGIIGVGEVTNTLRIQRQEGGGGSMDADRSKRSQSAVNQSKSSSARNGH